MAEVVPARALVPCAVTMLGLILALFVATKLAAGELAIGWLLLAQACDVVDGMLARRLGACSRFGAALDWHADVTVAAVLLAAAGLWPLIPIAVVVQAACTTRHRRVSGRTLAVIIAAAWALA